ncbi:hypothetical protein QVD17_31726 [Tagetes erecta]|uniref:Uncharacterized protein n=1 Tax=Tagetes erecta TaxID=13708 RepID=A0AAD8NPK7_TARER|nr:hypothetical protein QVD17_31726 [Tagetes erecta]
MKESMRIYTTYLSLVELITNLDLPLQFPFNLSIQVLVKFFKKLMSETNDGNPMPSKEQEEAVIKKKYGGLLPKKNPLISKDHDRAFFDSADWALGKQGSQKSKGPLEALRPKLQPTPQQQSRSRRSAYAPAGEGEVDGGNGDMDNDEKDVSKDQETNPPQ